MQSVVQEMFKRCSRCTCSQGDVGLIGQQRRGQGDGSAARSPARAVLAERGTAGSRQRVASVQDEVETGHGVGQVDHIAAVHALGASPDFRQHDGDVAEPPAAVRGLEQGARSRGQQVLEGEDSRFNDNTYFTREPSLKART